MHILADENIALVQEAFAPLGDLRLLPGRQIDNAAVRQADVLLVRSVTRVDAELLAGSRLSFVGSATSGVDHVDTDFLHRQQIPFASAPGSNADSVVDYVFSSLALLARQKGLDWTLRSFGIVGCGQVGSRLARRLLGLGISVRIHDPLLTDAHPLAEHFCSLDAVLRQDIVSLHTPLSDAPPHPSRDLLDADKLALLPEGGVLINAARGGVVNERALLQRLEAGPELLCVLDTWEGEPAIDPQLFARAVIGTAHIAGYSQAGKRRGTRMLLEALANAMTLESALLQQQLQLFADPLHSLSLPAGLPALDRCRQLGAFISQAYDVGLDSRSLQEVMAGTEAAAGFDRLRKHYPARLEFSQCRPPAGLPAALQADLQALNFGPATAAGSD